MIRVVVADDQAVVRAGLRMILESEEDNEVAGEAADGQQALDRVRTLDPDVVLMDIRMPALDGIDATPRLHAASARARVLILTTYDVDENVYAPIDRLVTGARPNAPAPPELEELTSRELEVLRLVARGLSNAEIARALVVSDGTVKTHVAHLLSKLGLRDRVQVVVFAYEHRIVQPGS
jgi:DNA-binding NarL/FixJ family response regulator